MKDISLPISSTEDCLKHLKHTKAQVSHEDCMSVICSICKKLSNILYILFFCFDTKRNIV